MIITTIRDLDEFDNLRHQPEAIRSKSSSNSTTVSYLKSSAPSRLGLIPILMARTRTGELSDPKMTIDGKGFATTLWIEREGHRFRLMSYRFNKSFSAMRKQVIHDAGDVCIERPQLIAQSMGHLMSIWIETSGDDQAIKCSRFIPRKGWQGADRINDPPGSIGTEPQIAITRFETTMVVWQQRDAYGYSVYAKHWTAEHGWGSSKRISRISDTPQTCLCLKTDANDGATAVWLERVGAFSYVYAARFNNSCGWMQSLRIDCDLATSVRELQLAIDSKGRSLAVWSQTDGIGHQIMISQSAKCTSDWVQPFSLCSCPTSTFTELQIGVDHKRLVLVVWRHCDGINNSVMCCQRKRDGSWQSPVSLEPLKQGYALKLAFSGRRYPAFAWREPGANGDAICVTWYFADSGWDQVQTYHSASHEHVYPPRIAHCGRRAVIVTWRQYDGTHINLFAAKSLQTKNPHEG